LKNFQKCKIYIGGHFDSVFVIHCSGYLKCIVETPIGVKYEDSVGRSNVGVSGSFTVPVI